MAGRLDYFLRGEALAPQNHIFQGDAWFFFPFPGVDRTREVRLLSMAGPSVALDIPPSLLCRNQCVHLILIGIYGSLSAFEREPTRGVRNYSQWEFNCWSGPLKVPSFVASRKVSTQNKK